VSPGASRHWRLQSAAAAHVDCPAAIALADFLQQQGCLVWQQIFESLRAENSAAVAGPIAAKNSSNQAASNRFAVRCMPKPLMKSS